MVKNANTVDRGREVRVGHQAGESNQGDYAVSIGMQSGLFGMGENSIAIGKQAGCSILPSSEQARNSIVLNATGTNLNTLIENSLVIKPIRTTFGHTSNLLSWDPVTGEVTHSYSTGSGDNLQTVTENGNTTTIHTSFLNPDISLTTLGDIVIGGDSINLGNVFVEGDVEIDGNLQVHGSLVVINTENLLVEDPIIELANNIQTNDQDVGIIMRRLSPESNVMFGYRGHEEEFALAFTNESVFTNELNPIGSINFKVYGNVFVGSNVQIIDTGSNVITVNGNIVANGFIYGDGSELSGINLQNVTEDGNTTTIHTSFLNPGISLNTVGNAVFGSPSNVTVDTTNRKVTFASNIVINSTLTNASISIGNSAGQIDQNIASIAIGYKAGENTQGSESVAIGVRAGQTSQGIKTVAIGNLAGEVSQNTNSIAIGNLAGQNAQGSDSVAVGVLAGYDLQGNDSIAIGARAGRNSQRSNAIAIGNLAGGSNQGSYGIAIGYGANTQDNSIVLNATNTPLYGSQANATYISPIRYTQDFVSNVISYETTQKEVIDSGRITINGSSGTVSITGNLVVSGNTTPASGFNLDVTGVTGTGIRISDSSNSSSFRTQWTNDTATITAAKDGSYATRMNFFTQVVGGNTSNTLHLYNSNVGVGTTNPLFRLDTRLTVQSGTAGPTANSYPIASFIGSETGGGGSRGLEIGVPTGSFTNSPVYLKTSGTGNRFGILNQSDVENFTITSDGKVGIGETIPDNVQLHIVRKGGTSGNLLLGTASAGNPKIIFRPGGSSPDGILDYNDTTNAFTFNNRLDVKTTGADGIVLQQDLGDANNSGRIFFLGSVQTYGIFNNAGDLRITHSAIPGNTSGTSFARFTNTGKYFRMESGTGGIQFNGDTAAVNALNDYEQGTWTPSFGGSTGNGTISYSFQSGTYTKVGNLVTCAFTIDVDTITANATGDLRILGLPFTPINIAIYRAGGHIANVQNIDVNGTAIMVEAFGSSTFMPIYGFNDNAIYQNAWANSLTTSSFINGSVTYHT